MSENISSFNGVHYIYNQGQRMERTQGEMEKFRQQNQAQRQSARLMTKTPTQQAHQDRRQAQGTPKSQSQGCQKPREPQNRKPKAATSPTRQTRTDGAKAAANNQETSKRREKEPNRPQESNKRTNASGKRQKSKKPEADNVVKKSNATAKILHQVPSDANQGISTTPYALQPRRFPHEDHYLSR
ncbi:hypothetical protein EC968_007299 [Mortierella alpina]|nr:hypothetical protein EC968_007299 [Mortierella alpina]